MELMLFIFSQEENIKLCFDDDEVLCKFWQGHANKFMFTKYGCMYQFWSPIERKICVKGRALTTTRSHKDLIYAGWRNGKLPSIVSVKKSSQ